MRTRDDRLLRAALLAASTALAAGVGEGVARSLELSKTWRSYRGGRDVQLAVHGGSNLVAGFRRPPHYRGHMFGHEALINRLGFRERDHPESKPPGTRRIVFLGDSVTEGFGVAAAARYTDVLETEARDRASTVRHESLNFAVGGHATVDEVKVLEEFALGFQPDIVFVQVCINDLERNRQLETMKREPEPAPKPAPGPKRFSPRQLLQENSALYLSLAERYSLVNLRFGGTNGILTGALATRPEHWNATLPHFRRLAKLCREHGVRLLVAYFPLDVEVQAREDGTGLFLTEQFRRLVIGVEGIEVVELTGGLRRESRSGLYLDDVHLTELGHRLVAGLLAPRLLGSS